MNGKFLGNFNSEDEKILRSYFEDLNKKIKLGKKDKKSFIEDFEKAIIYYSKTKSINETLTILSLDNLGDVYTKNPTNWYPLDNSAKIYPLSMKRNWMSLYRLSYYMNEEIVPEILQIALIFTMKRFPTFRTSVRKGFFWNYIDGIKKRFCITKESTVPCNYINISKVGKQSFNVLFYKNRISIEIFHTLTDAHGGIVFLSSLVTEYLKLLGKKVQYNDIVLDINGYIEKEEIRDEFINKKINSKTSGLIDSKALAIDGELSNISPCQIIHFDLSLNKLKELSHKHDITINELILSFLFIVLSKAISKDGNIKIQVPVNMRKFYKSKTIRNFSLYNNISLRKEEVTTLESVIKKVKKQSREKLSKDKINEVLVYSNKLVHSLRFIPLFIKRPIANFIYGFIGDKASTTVLSNLGIISLPKEVSENIKSADFVLGTTISNKALFSLITVNDISTLTVSKFTSNNDVENNLYKVLKDNDLIIRIHGSENYEDRKWLSYY